MIFFSITRVSLQYIVVHRVDTKTDPMHVFIQCFQNGFKQNYSTDNYRKQQLKVKKLYIQYAFRFKPDNGF